MAPDSLAQQAAALGLPPEIAGAMSARVERQAEAECEVMPVNWGAVRVFFAMGTQWRRAGMVGVPVGLDYAALPVACGALSIVLDEPLLARLRVLESAAAEAMIERMPKR